MRKTLDTNADGTAAAGDLAHRYVWGTAVDDLLADETVDDATADDVAWSLADHLHSVRDRVVYNPVSGTVSVAKHVTYDAYGNVTSDTAPGAASLFLYTAPGAGCGYGTSKQPEPVVRCRYRSLDEH